MTFVTVNLAGASVGYSVRAGDNVRGFTSRPTDHSRVPDKTGSLTQPDPQPRGCVCGSTPFPVFLTLIV